MRSFYKNGLVGAGVGLALVVLAYLGEQLLRLPFLPFDIFDWLARALPGDLVTFGIDSIVNLIIALNIGESTSGTAKQIEQLLALLLFIFLWTVAGWLVGGLSQRSRFSAPQASLSLALLLGGAIVIALNWPGVPDPFVLAWQLVLMLGGGWALGWILAGAPGEAATAAQRRHFLVQFGGAVLGFGLVSWGIGALFGRDPVETGADKAVESGAGGVETADVATDPAELQGRLPPAPGTRREITANDDFYRIDINTRPPLIEQTSWELQVAGLFANPRNLSLVDLMAFPAVTQPITLSCISNRIGGDLISTAEWTGVRLALLLEELGLQSEAQALNIEAEDGFHESVTMADMMDPRTLLVYAMNGQTLPQAHGFPLRIYIPNRYGMKQPKWITRIEAMTTAEEGYWVTRGWSQQARPHIVSIIDNLAVDEQTDAGRIPLGGIAWAGDRGITQVEVQVDDKPWQTAQLRTPPLSTLTWVQWRYDWQPEAGEHRFRVRATDGQGTLQIGQESSVRPDGATGYHTITRTISQI